MTDQFIPPEVRESLIIYARNHVPTGSFLAAVLSNDLFEAVGRADEANIRFLRGICMFIYNHLPASCWGSPEKFREWTSIRVSGDGEPLPDLDNSTARESATGRADQ